MKNSCKNLLNAWTRTWLVGSLGLAAWASAGPLARADQTFPTRPFCQSPDLTISSIETAWVGNGTQVTVIVRNQGRFAAPASEVDLYDHNQFRGTLPTPSLKMRGQATLQFFVPYNVFQPDAYLRAIVDPRNRIQECIEKNNTRDYSVIG